MMRDPKFWPGISAPHGEHVMKTFYDESGPFRLGALPMGLFMNGHGYFVGASHARLPPFINNSRMHYRLQQAPDYHGEEYMTWTG